MLEHFTAVFKIEDEGLLPGERLVLLCLANMANEADECWPSFSYIERRTNICRRTVIDHIKSLEGRYILVTERPNQSNIYTVIPGSANSALVQNLHRGSAKSAPGVVQNLHRGSAKSAPINNHRNNQLKQPIKNKGSEAAKKLTGNPSKKVFPAAEDIPEWLPPETLDEFVEMRRGLKKPISPGGVKRLIRKLDDFRAEGEDPVAILQKSVDRCWMDVYSLKNAEEAKQHGQRNGNTGRNPERRNQGSTDLFNETFGAARRS